jgi:acyl-CoA synthetase (AMP-forming)/AMP-acid ligase II
VRYHANQSLAKDNRRFHANQSALAKTNKRAAERRAKIAAAYRQKLIAKKKKRQLEEAKRVLQLDRNLIEIAVLIIALPIIAALAAMLTVLAVGHH